MTCLFFFFLLEICNHVAVQWGEKLKSCTYPRSKADVIIYSKQYHRGFTACNQDFILVGWHELLSRFL